MASPAVERMNAWLEIAHRHEKETGKMPIILNLEIYEYFDERVKITEASEFEVLVENGWMTQKRVDPEELSLQPMFK